MANETRLINANEILEKGVSIPGCVSKMVSTWDIVHAPTVDAVEVIRCKECQEFAPGFIRPYLGWCSVWDTTVRETGFCHHGKPRSEEKPKPAWPPQEEMEEPCED